MRGQELLGSLIVCTLDLYKTDNYDSLPPSNRNENVVHKARRPQQDGKYWITTKRGKKKDQEHGAPDGWSLSKA